MMIGLTPISNYYLQLINEFPPRPIKNEDELRETQKRINFILDKANLTQDDQDYLKVLGMLVYDYEEKYEIFPELKPLEILDDLINNQGIKAEELLEIFESESIIFDILNNQCQITIEESKKLNNYAFNCFHGNNRSINS
jgi:HTH-type transcriptional regulator/antitoxin HigA